MPPKFARLAGLGAYGACAGMLALYAGLIFLTRPGGMLPALSWLSWISLGVVFAALIGAHIVIAKQLMHIGNGGGATPV